MLRTLARAILVIFALLATASFVTTAEADTRTALAGDGTGKTFESLCPDNLGLIGWGYEYMASVTIITALCQAVDETGLAHGDVVPSGSVAGMDGGKSADPITCKDNQVVRSLTAYLTKDFNLFYLRGTCKGPGNAPMLIRPTLTVINQNPTSDSKKGISCDTDEYATGLIGTYSNSGAGYLGIKSIGLTCHKIGETASAKPDKPSGDAAGPAPDANDNSGQGSDNGKSGGTIKLGNGGFNIEVQIGNGSENNGDKNSGQGSNKGKKTFAEQDTTIYSQPGGDEIAYLQKGDKVTIVVCEDDGDGWCQISKPQKGYVWGPDLH